MAVDRDKRSVAINKLGGCIAVSFCVLSTCVLQIVASKLGQSLYFWSQVITQLFSFLESVSDLDQPPISVITFLGETIDYGETASFNYSISREGNILWYMDDMFPLSLPQEYNISFVYERGSSRNGQQCIML
jgi:hypothetical protein